MSLAAIRKSGRFLESFLAFLAIVLLALFPLLEVIARQFFHTGIRNSTEYTHHLVLILAFIAAAIASDAHIQGTIPTCPAKPKNRYSRSRRWLGTPL